MPRQKPAAELKAEAPDPATFPGISIEQPPPAHADRAGWSHAALCGPRVSERWKGRAGLQLLRVLAATAYGETPRTRDDRAAPFARDHAASLGPMPPDGRAAVLALTKQFVVERPSRSCRPQMS